jgi:primosomal protein N' (replication factor Y)
MPSTPSRQGDGLPAPATERAVAVAVPVPYLDALTYLVPDGIAVPLPGVRVRVPLGRRSVVGTVLARISVNPAFEAKPLEAVLDDAPFVPPAVVELCQWVAEYYVSGIGDAIGVAMPPGSRTKVSGFKTIRVAHATAFGLDTARAGGQPGLTPKQRLALEELAGASAGLSGRALRERGVGGAVVTKLVAAGLATFLDERDERDPLAAASASTNEVAPALSVDQQSAFDTLQALSRADGFRAAVLYGVTGSGKTEVYVHLAETVCARGLRVLVLVPEIALTLSAVARFYRSFGGRVAVQHSGLSTGERHDQWHRIRCGEVDVVIGTRSAVFAPIDRLGLIIVDEEHDSSYKQEEVPRYHGRDVAVMRASREGALVVLGSATPSLESFRNADTGRYARVSLDRRVLDRPLASVRLVDMRTVYAEEGPDVVISQELAAAIGDRLTKGEQSLVLLNRRGYSTSVFCRQCTKPMECPHCSVSLTVHGARRSHDHSRISRTTRTVSRGRARCHYCNYAIPVPAQCPVCASPYMEQAGFGTERVEEEVRSLYPDARMARIDRDSIRKRGALTSLLSRFATGQIDVLVGTQMIAKGHDFPGVTLVGVISADVGLGLPDFRAAERTFQLLTQVAGRAGRGERLGEAIIQTLNPGHYSVELACRQDYVGFYEKEVDFRRAMQYPPLFALINVIVRGKTEDAAMLGANLLVRRLQPVEGFRVLGPAPAPLGRLRGEHRVQLFLKGPRRVQMRDRLRQALDGLPALRRRVSIDVDPMTVL